MRTRYLLAFISLFVIAFLLLFIIIKHNSKESKLTELPNFEIPIFESNIIYSDINSTTEKNSVVIFFSPDCEYCDEEINGILKSNRPDEDVKWIFITNPMVVNDLALFLQRNPISQLKNSVILIDSSFRYHNLFGVMAPPATFIFKKGKLKYSFLHFITAEKLIQKLTK